MGLEDDAGRTPPRTWIIPIVSVMLGSLATIVPVIFPGGLLPPLGLMMLLAWRLLRPESLKIWTPVLLGLFDDLLSGQPFGSAMLLWTLCFFVIELIEIRLVFRDFWQDWLIAAGAIGFTLLAGRALASPIEAHVDTIMALQILVSILVFPLIARLVARLDRTRLRA
ncbi:rod shape-determining protein MreD [Hephaestia sp. MAHUQ-44]|nr:rod shape-determining protein MreD [Hephaestia sp. MAHUQ-44]MCM8731313.1 rod shape-determining protein MreD [Hephaestia sp. MAHUQ-44]